MSRWHGDRKVTATCLGQHLISDYLQDAWNSSRRYTRECVAPIRAIPHEVALGYSTANLFAAFKSILFLRLNLKVLRWLTSWGEVATESSRCPSFQRIMGGRGQADEGSYETCYRQSLAHLQGDDNLISEIETCLNSQPLQPH